MSNPIKTYRVYCFDAVQKVVSADFIQAVSDGEAIAMAKAKRFRSKCAVWDDRRLVAELAEERKQA